MSTGRRSWIVLLLASSTLGAGCSQPGGSMLTRRTSLGSMKTSLSQLEFENQQLRRQVASLRTESRQAEDRLVQEETANGELSARLDDARNLLSERGVVGNDLGPEAPAKTLPASSSTRKRRKTPFAQIPGRVDLPETTVEPDSGNGWESTKSRPGKLIGPQSLLDGPRNWIPVAVGVTESTPPRR